MNQKTIRKRLKKIMSLCMTGAALQAIILLRLCYDLVHCPDATFGHFCGACVAAALLYGLGWSGMTIYGWLYVREQDENTKQ